MRHPIDDIFKEGLINQKHGLKQGDWFKVKDMLNLEKRKRRFPIWWLGAAASLLLAAIMIPIFYMGQEFSINETSINVLALDKESKIAEIDKIADSNIITNSENKDQENTSPKPKNIDIIKTNNINELARAKATSNNGNQKTPVKKNKDISSNLKDSTSNTEEHAEVGVVLALDEIPPTEENISLSQVGNAVNFPEPAVVKSNANTSANKLDYKDQTKKGLAQISIVYLSQCIHALESRIELPQIADHRLKLVSEYERIYNPWSLGIYTSYTIPNAKPSLGLILNWDISSRWSSSIGIGINYLRRNDLEFTGELDVIDANGFRQISNVIETLSFRRLSLEIPVSVGYRIDRHSIMAIALAETNLWSELRQNSTVSNAEILDIEPASPNMLLKDPLTIVQNATTINEANLSMPKYDIGVGYLIGF